MVAVYYTTYSTQVPTHQPPSLGLLIYDKNKTVHPPPSFLDLFYIIKTDWGCARIQRLNGTLILKIHEVLLKSTSSQIFLLTGAMHRIFLISSTHIKNSHPKNTCPNEINPRCPKKTGMRGKTYSQFNATANSTTAPCWCFMMYKDKKPTYYASSLNIPWPLILPSGRWKLPAFITLKCVGFNSTPKSNLNPMFSLSRSWTQKNKHC